MIITFHELANLDIFFEQTNLTLGGIDYEFSLHKGPKMTLFNISFLSPKGTKITIKTKLYPNESPENNGRIFASEQFEVYLRRSGKDEIVYAGDNTEEIIGPNTQAAVEKALSDLVAEGQKISVQDSATDWEHLLELDNEV
jgi:hypothetical protein